jgi:hypothetical protein
MLRAFGNSRFVREHNFGRPANIAKAVLVKVYTQHLKTKVKLCVGFYQVVSLLHQSYNVPYPFEYLHFSEKFQFLSMDITKVSFGPCIFGPWYTFSAKVFAIGFTAILICFSSGILLAFAKGKNPRVWAKKGLPWLPTVLFFVYPGFSSLFFNALTCRKIDQAFYVSADVSVSCDSSPEYVALSVFATSLVIFWACGLPLITLRLLWPVRTELRKGRVVDGFQQHLKDFYSPYKPSMWFFECFDYAKKLLLIGFVPALSDSSVVGAVVALVVVNMYIALLLSVSPYAKKADNFLAVCLNGLLLVVILISVLLKMDAAYLTGRAAVGIKSDVLGAVLVACNVLVLITTVVAYVISVKCSKHSPEAELEMLQGIQETEDETTAYRQLAPEE